jgi:hypothetical protein
MFMTMNDRTIKIYFIMYLIILIGFINLFILFYRLVDNSRNWFIQGWRELIVIARW